MKNCDAYRHALEQRFDAGEALSSADGHASECAACDAFRLRMLRVDSAFRAIPLETPRAGFEAALKARLAVARAPESDARWWLPAAALIACMIAVTAAWYYAVPLEPAFWWDAANEYAAVWTSDSTSWSEEIASLNEYWDTAADGLARISGPALWGATASAVAMLLFFNGVEARRINTMKQRRS